MKTMKNNENENLIKKTMFSLSNVSTVDSQSLRYSFLNFIHMKRTSNSCFLDRKLLE